MTLLFFEFKLVFLIYLNQCENKYKSNKDQSKLCLRL